MRKTVVLLIIVILVLSLCACDRRIEITQWKDFVFESKSFLYYDTYFDSIKLELIEVDESHRGDKDVASFKRRQNTPCKCYKIKIELIINGIDINANVVAEYRITNKMLVAIAYCGEDENEGENWRINLSVLKRVNGYKYEASISKSLGIKYIPGFETQKFEIQAIR